MGFICYVIKWRGSKIKGKIWEWVCWGIVVFGFLSFFLCKYWIWKWNSCRIFFNGYFINVNKKLSVENIKRLLNICIIFFLEKVKS